MRHWKQRYSFDADLIFSRTMKLGICGVAVVKPGDPVTEEMKRILGRNRLRLWWESKRIELARFDGDLGVQLPPSDEDMEAKLEAARERITGTTDPASIEEPEPEEDLEDEVTEDNAPY